MQEKTDFCLRIKKNVYLELNEETKTLQELGLLPGMSVYYQGIKLTKSKGFEPVNLAAKWKKTYQNKKTKEPWFIMTSKGAYFRSNPSIFSKNGDRRNV